MACKSNQKSTMWECSSIAHMSATIRAAVRGLHTGTPEQPRTEAEVAARAARLAQVHAAVALLSPVQRDIATRRLAGQRERDIAAQTGRSTSQVMSAWRHARLNLTARLAPPPVPAPRPAPVNAAVVAARAARAADNRARLLAAVASLPAGQREVATMRLNSLRACDIQRATGRSKGAVNSAWCAARRALGRAGLTVTP
jgi:DNA-directed RNA polymerase specialized sigma24 family protein